MKRTALDPTTVVAVREGNGEYYYAPTVRRIEAVFPGGGSVFIAEIKYPPLPLGPHQSASGHTFPAHDDDPRMAEYRALTHIADVQFDAAFKAAVERYGLTEVGL